MKVTNPTWEASYFISFLTLINSVIHEQSCKFPLDRSTAMMKQKDTIWMSAKLCWQLGWVGAFRSNQPAVFLFGLNNISFDHSLQHIISISIFQNLKRLGVYFLLSLRTYYCCTGLLTFVHFCIFGYKLSPTIVYFLGSFEHKKITTAN